MDDYDRELDEALAMNGWRFAGAREALDARLTRWAQEEYDDLGYEHRDYRIPGHFLATEVGSGFIEAMENLRHHGASPPLEEIELYALANPAAARADQWLQQQVVSPPAALAYNPFSPGADSPPARAPLPMSPGAASTAAGSPGAASPQGSESSTVDYTISDGFNGPGFWQSRMGVEENITMLLSGSGPNFPKEDIHLAVERFAVKWGYRRDDESEMSDRLYEAYLRSGTRAFLINDIREARQNQLETDEELRTVFERPTPQNALDFERELKRYWFREAGISGDLEPHERVPEDVRRDFVETGAAQKALLRRPQTLPPRGGPQQQLTQSGWQAPGSRPAGGQPSWHQPAGGQAPWQQPAEWQIQGAGPAYRGMPNDDLSQRPMSDPYAAQQTVVSSYRQIPPSGRFVPGHDPQGQQTAGYGPQGQYGQFYGGLGQYGQGHPSAGQSMRPVHPAENAYSLDEIAAMQIAPNGPGFTRGQGFPGSGGAARPHYPPPQAGQRPPQQGYGTNPQNPAQGYGQR
ncbi:hypothetical protein [Micromonospora sp. SH-82]|uniref:hypothetical protein n=1 Tax=Micromonospora sp. SH-82 TaxID=3132938 RepID=UPI003EBF38BC